MIQADETLLKRARRAARDRGITFPQFVRDALERELRLSSGNPPPLTCIGVVETGEAARERAYEPDSWR